MKSSVILATVLIGASVTAQAEGVWEKTIDPAAEPVPVTVYRSPTCGCCGIWLDHLKKHNFQVTDIKTNDVQMVKMKYGITGDLASCHTAVIGDYAIEGHVPAGDIRKLLKEKPAVSGLSVPQMPHGTPGMEMSGKKQPFSVVSFDSDGNTKVFSEYLFY